MLAAMHSVTLLVVGVWLLVYRVALRTQWRPTVERVSSACAGLPPALFAPLFPWPPESYQAFILAVVGVLFSCCHPVLTAVVLAISLGIGSGSFAWQLGLCSILPEVFGMSLHSTLLTLMAVLFIVVFVFLPGVAGPEAVVHILVPLVAALLIVLGAAGLHPNQGIDSRALLAVSPCNIPDHNSLVIRSFVAWVLLTAVGMAFQFFMMRLAQRAQVDADEASSGLVTALLPDAQKEEGGGASLPRPGENADSENRFKLITKAIFADEGADQSHLTENERKIVEVCKKDEFERDRLLWGGGLI